MESEVWSEHDRQEGAYGIRFQVKVEKLLRYPIFRKRASSLSFRIANNLCANALSQPMDEQTDESQYETRCPIAVVNDIL
jgi:hypothetical protein